METKNETHIDEEAMIEKQGSSAFYGLLWVSDSGQIHTNMMIQL